MNNLITLELTSHEAWLIQYLLDKFRSNDNELLNHAHTLYEKLMDARLKASVQGE